MNNFWQELKKPIIGMAPMDGVTDAAFRHMLAKHGKLARKNFDNQNLGGPDVMFTEFVPTDGIYACLRRQACMGGETKAERPACAGRVLDGLIYGENERPIVAQIFGSSPEKFYATTPFVCELGFDGIDINMGCPERAIVKSGGGAALIDNPKLAGEIVMAVKKGIADWASGKIKLDLSAPACAGRQAGLPENMASFIRKYSHLKERKIIPVSVKTRIGTKNNSIKEWAKYLSEMDLSAVSLHGRTLKQMYEGKADWDAIAVGAEIIKKSGAVVLGNGDIKSIDEAKEKARKYNLDGALVGRAAMGNPLFFSGVEPNAKDKLNFAMEHARIYEEVAGHKRFVNMRKHLIWYASGFENASDVRLALMKAENAVDCEKIIKGAIGKL